jgi:hypothetical protein
MKLPADLTGLLAEDRYISQFGPTSWGQFLLVHGTQKHNLPIQPGKVSDANYFGA